jgi:hypothetical protein
MKYARFGLILVGVFLFFSGCSTPDIADGDIDLDTTYFPFGLGYEWCYERHYYGYEDYEPFSEYDTVTIRVNDSFWIYDTMKFGFDHFFYDLTNPVSIVNDSIILYMSFMTYDFKQPISLVEQSEIDDLLAYQGDTMVIATGDFDGLYSAWTEVKRRKGIGAFFMLSQSGYVDPYAYDYNVNYRLLSFYNGKDTVYKAPRWDEKIDLDTTYFPLGMYYTWVFFRHDTGDAITGNGDDTTTWDVNDTFTVSVSDSFFLGDTTMRICFADTGKPFNDLGNPTSIKDCLGNCLVLVELNGGHELWINAAIDNNGRDTLLLEYSNYQADSLDVWTKRIRRIGTVFQYSFYKNSSGWRTITDSLILFTTPEGQVWP